jgi:hypothetical protein
LSNSSDNAIEPRRLSTRVWRYLTWAAVLAFAAYRLPELVRYSLWYDEVFSFTLAQMEWGELLSAAVADRTNPPLFYILLKLWIGLGGESEPWLRLLPCAIGIGAAVPLVGLARRFYGDGHGGKASAVAAIAAGAASPLLVFLSNEVRGYSLLLLLSLLSLRAFYRVVDSLEIERALRDEVGSPSALGHFPEERKRRIVMLALVNTLLVYTHYFGWLLVAAELVVALAWYRAALRWVLASTLAAGIAFAPWAVAVARSPGTGAKPLSNVDWITMPTVGDIPLFFDALVARVLSLDTAGVGMVIMLVLVAVMGIAVVSPRRADGEPGNSSARELAVLAILPVVLAYVASVALGRSVFVPRYLIVAAPAWWLLVGATVAALGALTARGAHELERRFRVGATAATFAIFTLTCGLFREIRGEEKIQYMWLTKSIWLDAARGKPERRAVGTIYTLEGFTALPMAYYANRYSEAQGKLEVRPLTADTPVQGPAWLVERSLPSGEFRPVESPILGHQLAGRVITTQRVPSHGVRVFRIERP